MGAAHLMAAEPRTSADAWLERRSGVLLAAAVVIYAVQAVASVLLLTSGLDEGLYLIKSWLYTTGQVQPYGPEDPTGYMPLVFVLEGWWQRLVGVGHLSTRSLGALLGLACVLGVYGLGRSWLPRRWQAATAAALLACTPLAVQYLVWEPQYGAVSLLALATAFAVTRQAPGSWLRWAVAAGIGYFLLYFFRVNMLPAIGMFLVLQVASAPRPRWRGPLVSVAVAAGLTWWLIAQYPAKLAMAALWIPGVTRLLVWLGVEYPYADVFANGAEADVLSGASGWSQALGGLMAGYFIPYLPVVLLAAVGVVWAVRLRDWRSRGAFAALYFLAMSAIHFVGSQSYCPGCIRPYTNYFYVFGVLGAAYGAAVLVSRMAERPPYARGLAAGGATFLALVSLISMSSRSLEMLTPPGRTFLGEVGRLAELVDAHVPPDAHVLALGGLPYTPQAIFLAGRQLEITSLDQDHSYFRLAPDLSPERKARLLPRVAEMAMWTDEMMDHWLREEHDFVLWADTGEPFQRKWLPLVQQQFTPVASLELSGERIVLSARRP